MSTIRYTIRPRYIAAAEGGGHHGSTAYQVVDGGQVVATLPTQHEAAKHVLAPGGRLALDWKKTVIGGISEPRDFVARFGDVLAGRVLYVVGGNASDTPWYWTMNAQMSSRVGVEKGRAADKTEAAVAVERAFTHFLAALE